MPLAEEFSAADQSLHQLKAFDCGKPKMNEFLARFAIKHVKLGLSRTFVLPDITRASEKTKVAAYYTLAASSVAREGIPVEQSLPRYPIPVAILARLAVDKHYMGRGLGAKTLVYALRHANRLVKQGLPAYGLILDVLDNDALGFYRHFDMFEPFTDDPTRLFVSIKTLEKI